MSIDTVAKNHFPRHVRERRSCFHIFTHVRQQLSFSSRDECSNDPFLSLSSSASKHVVFGEVLSGQSIVDAIEGVAVDLESHRPLKDVVISKCGQMEATTSNVVQRRDGFV